MCQRLLIIQLEVFVTFVKHCEQIGSWHTAKCYLFEYFDKLYKDKTSMIPSASTMFPASDICFPLVSRHEGAGGQKQFGMLKKLLRVSETYL